MSIARHHAEWLSLVPVKGIPDEIKRETEAIRARFADPQARMFPVSVTFLVPEKMAGGV